MMGDEASEWLSSAEEDLAVARDLVEDHPSIAADHAHQAAEKGLNPLQIHREGDHDRPHDLVRLHRRLAVPQSFQSVPEDLNPADTAARYPDADQVVLDDPLAAVRTVGERIEWIRKRSSEWGRTSSTRRLALASS